MEPIIAPVSLDIIKAELTPNKKLRDTNKSNNEIYVINHHDSPNIMREIGRLREEAFRDSGGGSGLSMDIDEFDTMENPYQQLIVWDPDAERILGGYRYILGSDIRLDENGQPLLATSHMFHFSSRSTFLTQSSSDEVSCLLSTRAARQVQRHCSHWTTFGMV